jgi:tricorn protease
MKKYVYLLFAIVYASQAMAASKLLRHPDIHGQQVVFSYAGDLWIADTDSATQAQRLTSHPGIELFPKFSPDGTQVAFTGQYRGDDQVYVIDLTGGEPKQLTYYPTRGPLPTRWGTDHQVYGWNPDGKQVLFRSMRDDFENGQLYQVSVDGGLPKVMPMPQAGSGDISPEGDSILYSPLIRDFRSWKRYSGGWAQNLHIYNLQSDQATQITDHPGTERDPVWLESGMYFISDRDGTLELFQYNRESGDKTQLTQHATMDIKWASGDGKSRIIYELGPELAVYDSTTGQETPLSIEVPDDGVRRIAQRFAADKIIEDFTLAPDGKRALFSARGDIFSVPVEHGITRNLSQAQISHDRAAIWSPDGKWVAYISDRSGEQQIHLVAAIGGESRQLTQGLNAHLNQPMWSPDSNHIAFYTHLGELRVVDLKGKSRVVTKNRFEPPQNYTWSPDSQWLAFSQMGENGNAYLSLWSKKSGELHEDSEKFFNIESPQFSPDGKHLYYLSQREFAPQLSIFEWNYVADRATGIFALALNSDSGSPFSPRNDEVQGKDFSGKKDDEANEKSVPKTNIEFDQIEQRIIRVPVDADNIKHLSVTDKYIIYSTEISEHYGREFGGVTIHVYDLEKRESKLLAKNVEDIKFSYNGEYALIKQDSTYKRLEIAKAGDNNDSEKTLNTKNMIVYRAPSDEWLVVFDEVWRRFRDFFYVRNMHGYDWQGLKTRYRPIVSEVSTREDLNYLISEMVAELNVGHAYVQGGDIRAPHRSTAALLGARFTEDKSSKRYKVGKIFTGQNAEPKYRSPLTQVGVNINEGDYILEIDGRDLTTKDNPYDLLTDRGKQPVELLVNSKARKKGARRVLVDPISDEQTLVYLAWVKYNHDYVTEKTGGKIGYLHIPDMGANGIYEFIKWFYPQLHKQGMIIDVRGNGGGNVSSMILQRLWKKPLAYDYPAHSDRVNTYPYDAFIGPMVSLISETSGSDGDIFPYFFRKSGLGRLIGKRTWGGTVGISFRGSLIDGGAVFVPEFGLANKEGQWIIEGKGVEPDIEVENDPGSRTDAQLDRAISEILKEVQLKKPMLPPRPKAPIKTF